MDNKNKKIKNHIYKYVSRKNKKFFFNSVINYVIK